MTLAWTGMSETGLLLTSELQGIRREASVT